MSAATSSISAQPVDTSNTLSMPPLSMWPHPMFGSNSHRSLRLINAHLFGAGRKDFLILDACRTGIALLLVARISHIWRDEVKFYDCLNVLPSLLKNGLPLSVRPQQTSSSGCDEEGTSASAAAASPDGTKSGVAAASTTTTTTTSEETVAETGVKGSAAVLQGGGETSTPRGGSSGAAEKRAAAGDTPAGAPPPAKRAWRDQPHVGKYKLIRTLGSGNFAKVKLAQHITTKKEVAVKVIDKGKLNHASLSKLFREVNVMKQLNHPNIGECRSFLSVVLLKVFAKLIGQKN
ncbi:unnamed protein product [Rodentolepis nana]|uniref:non-specific serine/threonine protein kinase n=1 Tax=Rodentolepis nana TaxID=102285 RepID=A0A0R3T103_RODNA|nr:unnamed protein product [Rodentolepis nana]